MKIGKRARIKVEALIRELCVANGWRRDSQVYGVIVERIGERVGVDVGGNVLWFDVEYVEDAQRQYIS